MQRVSFLVGERPYCIWHHDLKRVAAEFLDSVDPSYFEFVATNNVPEGDEEFSHHAVLAIRNGLHQAIETLFTFLGATLQAPGCPYAWITNCRQTETLRRMVECIARGNGKIFNRCGLERVTWDNLALLIFRHSNSDASRKKETSNLFATLWQRFAYQFLDEMVQEEYNSIKHGLRLGLGGFTLSFGNEQIPGESAKEMHSLGGSKFGASYFVTDQIPHKGTKKQSPHLQISDRSVNWDPEADALKLQLASLSLKNIVSFLRIVNGISPEEVQFVRPSDTAEFDRPWFRPIGVLNSTFRSGIKDIPEELRLTPENILRILRNDGNCKNVPDQ